MRGFCPALSIALALAGGVFLAAQAREPSSTASAAALDITGMVLVPAGDFWMGRTRLWLIEEIGWQVRDRTDDRPVHRVTVPAFYMDTHEVSNLAYAAFVATGGAEAPYQWGGRTPPAAKERLPVYNVNWDEAAAYCRAHGKRLPTEAEWEKAARGGGDDLDYPWGNDYITEVEPATTGSESGTGTARDGQREIKHAHGGSATGPVPVGSFEPNGYGLYDMSGNLWEWVGDWYELYYYSVSPIENPKGPANGLYRVIRGGSWADPETRHATVYFRNYTAPDLRAPTLGFRCAATASSRTP